MLTVKQSFKAARKGLVFGVIASAVVAFGTDTQVQASDSSQVSNHTYRRFDSGTADRLIQGASRSVPTRVIKAEPLIGNSQGKSQQTSVRSSNTGSTTLLRTSVSDVTKIVKQTSDIDVKRKPTALIGQRKTPVQHLANSTIAYTKTNSRIVRDNNARIVRNYQASYPQSTDSNATSYVSSARHRQVQPLSQHAAKVQTVAYGNMYYPSNYTVYNASQYWGTYPSSSYYCWPNYYHSRGRGYYTSPRTHYTRHYPSHTSSRHHHRSHGSHYGGYIGYSSHGSSYGFHYGSRGSSSRFRIGVSIGSSCRW
jgi:hypothetical protein